jgi:hypothetical protein
MCNVFSFQLLTVGRRLPFVLKRIIRSQYVVAKEHVPEYGQSHRPGPHDAQTSLAKSGVESILPPSKRTTCCRTTSFKGRLELVL